MAGLLEGEGETSGLGFLFVLSESAIDLVFARVQVTHSQESNQPKARGRPTRPAAVDIEVALDGGPRSVDVVQCNVKGGMNSDRFFLAFACQQSCTIFSYTHCLTLLLTQQHVRSQLCVYRDVGQLQHHRSSRA